MTVKAFAPLMSTVEWGLSTGVRSLLLVVSEFAACLRGSSPNLCQSCLDSSRMWEAPWLDGWNAMGNRGRWRRRGH
jgi:hypothetical protein